MKQSQVRASGVARAPSRAIVAGLLLLGACIDPTGPRVPADAIEIVPGSSAAWSRTSTTEKGFSIPITITNDWDQTIYVVSGGCGANVEQNLDGAWRMLPNHTICSLVANPPIRLAPGESVALVGVFYTIESFALTAQHRLILSLAVEDDDGFRLLADDVGASSPFLVTNDP